MKNILTSTLLLFCVTLSLAQKKEILALKLVKGQTYIQNLASAGNVEQNVMGQEMDTKVQMSGKMKFTVTDVTNGIYTLATKYDRIGLKMTMPHGDMHFDSDNTNPNDMFAGVMAGLKDRGFTIKLNSLGRVIDVTGMENLFNTAAFETLSDAQKTELKATFMQSYGKGNISENLETSTAIFPSNPVAIGDKWTITGKSEPLGNATLETIYELKGITDAHYILSATSVIKPSDGDYYKKQGGMEVKMNMRGTSNGELKLDKKTGWIAEGKIEQTLEGTNVIKPNDQIPDGITTQLKMTTVTTMSNK